MCFSWLGVKLVVDLQIDPKGPQNAQNAGEIARRDHNKYVREGEPENDAAAEGPGGTRECKIGQFEEDSLKDVDFVPNRDTYDGDDSNQRPSIVEGECGAAAQLDVNWTHSSWPDWGEPLPPEDPDDDIDIEGAAQVTSHNNGKSSDLSPWGVSCSRESFNSANVPQAWHLLKVGNGVNFGDSKALGFESLGDPGKRESDNYGSGNYLERLSEMVEKIYAAVPELCIISSSQGTVSSRDVGFWTIEVSKDPVRLRIKRIKRMAQFDGLGVLDVYDENEVLERPRWKRQYKSLNKF